MALNPQSRWPVGLWAPLALLLAGCGGRAAPPPPIVSLLALHPAAEEARTQQGSEIGLVEVAGEEHPSIVAHTPSELLFPAVPVHAGASLEIATSLVRPERAQGDGVDFVVSLRDGEGQTELLRHTALPAAAAAAGWLAHRIDLSPWQGRRVDLVLALEPGSGARGIRGAWGSPRIVAMQRHRALAGAAEVSWYEPLARIPAQGAEIEVPPGGVLTVGGTLRRSSRHSRPTWLTVEIDGETVLRRTVRMQRGWDAFEETLPLERWSGRRVTPVARIGPLSQRMKVVWRDSLLSVERHTPRAASRAGRNLLLVVVDTLRRDHMSLYGYPRATTPALDELAARSMVWDQAVSSSSWTMPSTASLLSGLWPTEHGVTDGQPLPAEVATLADRLQREGFTTVGVSANPLVGRGEGFAQGHEHFVHVPWARAETLSRLLSDLLRIDPGSRWYAYAHFIDPHDPYDAPGELSRAFGDPDLHVERSELQALAKQVNFGGEEVEHDAGMLRSLVDSYDEEILYWDQAFGAFLAALDTDGLLDDTIVVVTSDHGEEFLEHDRLKHGLQLYEETVGVPLLIHAPGLVPPGRERSLPVEPRLLPDLLVELLQADGPVSAERLTRSLKPRGNLVYMHTGHAHATPGGPRTDLLALRNGRWKLVEMPVSGWRGLFDLEVDPGETRNLAVEREDLVARYGPLLERWWAEGSTPGEPQEEILDKLRALGYIQ